MLDLSSVMDGCPGDTSSAFASIGVGVGSSPLLRPPQDVSPIVMALVGEGLFGVSPLMDDRISI